MSVRSFGNHRGSLGSAPTVRNTVDPVAIRRKASGPLLEALAPHVPGRTRFVIVRRMSPKKAQERAIRARAMPVREGRNAELVVVGSGALKALAG